MPMTINASTERQPYNLSRPVVLNTCFLLGTTLLATAAFAAEFYYTALMQLYLTLLPPAHTPAADWAALLAKLKFFSNFSWQLIAVMLIGIIGSTITLI
jgi:hypothetical protein